MYNFEIALGFNRICNLVFFSVHVIKFQLLLMLGERGLWGRRVFDVFSFNFCLGTKLIELFL